MSTLRSRSALRLLAALALCAPMAACDDKKMTGGTPRMAATGAPFARPEAAPADPARRGRDVEYRELPALRRERLRVGRPRAAVHVLGQRRYRGVQHRPGEDPRVGSSRPRTPSASPTCSTTSTTTTRSRRATPRSPPPSKWPRARGTRSTTCCASRLAAKKYAPGEMPARNLVFLIDTSGSMDGAEPAAARQASRSGCWSTR